MDPDIRAALFEGCDQEGEFEVLDDDFVTQVVIHWIFLFFETFSSFIGYG